MDTDPTVPHPEPADPTSPKQGSGAPFSQLSKSIGEVALILVGIAYVAGFIVLFTFQNRLGVREGNIDFLKIRYIYTGLLWMAFPLFVIIPVGAHLWSYRRQRDSLDRFKELQQKGTIVGKSRLPYTVQILCVSGALTAFVLFEPYGVFHGRLTSIMMLLAMTVIPVTVPPLKRHFGFAAEVEHPRLRWLLAGVSVLLLIWSLWGSWRYLSVIAQKGSSYLMFIVALTLYLASAGSAKPVELFPGQKEGTLLARWAVVITLTILSMFSFAYRVYPNIPADKGGGNYFYSRDAVICASPESALPSTLISTATPGCSTPLKILEITDTTVFAARSDDRGTNGKSILSASDDRAPSAIWSDGEYFPTIYAISRNKISFIRYDFQLP